MVFMMAKDVDPTLNNASMFAALEVIMCFKFSIFMMSIGMQFHYEIRVVF